jgi:hypothetical protein
MSRTHPLSTEVSPAIKLAARQRVEAVWTCLDVLCPDLALEAKKEIAEKVFELCRGEDRKPPRIQITPAQVTSIICRTCSAFIPAAPCCCFQIKSQTNSMSFSRGKNENLDHGRR